MVAAKMRLAMGLHKHEPPPPPPPSSPKPHQKTVFSRSFGVYFPRSSAQVQPRPPDVVELLRLVEQLRERESRLKTELLEHKLLRESVAIVPVLESQISAKCIELDMALERSKALELENERLRRELTDIAAKAEEERDAGERKVQAMEDEIAELKRTAEYYMSSSQRFQGLVEVSGKSNLIKSLRRGVKCMEIGSNHESNSHTIDASDSKRRVLTETERPRPSESTLHSIRSSAPRVPKPPPIPSSLTTGQPAHSQSLPVLTPPPSKSARPPPPPPPPKGLRPVPAKVRRVPEVAEFYHSLMRRDSRRDSSTGVTDVPANTNARDMIGEIENRSAHLLAIKTDVETQGEFIRFLIKEVETAGFTNIEDVVPFVKWLDDELSYLVDERAVLKHFNWPEQKADALREASFGYSDLKKILTEASSFRIDARQHCSPALKKMQGLLEKLEHGVYNLSRMRESATKRYRNFQIPMDWMQEAGIAHQMKLASVKVAMKYMKRVSAEVDTIGGGPEEEEMIVQGVRFAFRVHQFAGGFDAETMRAFQELKDKAESHLICSPPPT